MRKKNATRPSVEWRRYGILSRRQFSCPRSDELNEQVNAGPEARQNILTAKWPGARLTISRLNAWASRCWRPILASNTQIGSKRCTNVVCNLANPEDQRGQSGPVLACPAYLNCQNADRCLSATERCSSREKRRNACVWLADSSCNSSIRCHRLGRPLDLVIFQIGKQRAARRSFFLFVAVGFLWSLFGTGCGPDAVNCYNCFR